LEGTGWDGATKSASRSVLLRPPASLRGLELQEGEATCAGEI
jgi:hypothetical protein